MNKKLQVFVSSTYLDLKEERQKAVEGILRAGHIPAGMELFTAASKSQWLVIEEWIKESDVLMLILGGKYGSVEPDSGKSYTQLEYEFALKHGIPVFAIVLNDQYLINKKSSNISLEVYEREVKDPQIEKYDGFRKLVLSNLVRFVENISEITSEVAFSLQEFVKKDGTEYKFRGWIRGTNIKQEQTEYIEQPNGTSNTLPIKSNKIIINDSNEERVVWLLPRGFLLFTDITYSSYDSWAVVISYYNYEGEWQHSTHYHESYSRSWDRNMDVQFRKLSIPKADWLWSRAPLRFLMELREVTEKVDIKRLVENEQKSDYPVYYFEPKKPIELPEIPSTYEYYYQTGNLRDIIDDIEDEEANLRLSIDKLIEKVITVRQSVYLECLAYLGENHPSVSFIKEVLDEYKNTFSQKEILQWFSKVETVLRNTLNHEWDVWSKKLKK
ncbi:DUF4062 domain-containing protein [Bacillus inaquosorum]|uniref:DUF4062 domain-containing protein n=1 Tax=Bacillus inaquosorum TaxID=483913 RepID=UPI002282A8EB|nr:DUF4062 domain-containing protein [Bacillus inaquosorum]MCY7902773.1 DUF4062 domain-containing protein [Bacillus inaquosorum]MCY8056211.1 DUF4062 domain-containing protein [Bacillus inaquosorum]MCY8262137.1 DUF4062 domain-containing protein [Bacillus inaquosorum]MCY9070311.1 DUF4062 domain-containing protein [Bacillus inaquosorum]MCY9409547.1 DUF4062 domain-containing protein [Bacillus inaquosorum]